MLTAQDTKRHMLSRPIFLQLWRLLLFLLLLPLLCVKCDDDERELEIAVNGEGLLWAELPQSELARRQSSAGPRPYTAHYTHIYVPVLYGADADKYGIASPQVRSSFFEIYLRKFQWTGAEASPAGSPHNDSAVKHVLLVSGGPGESGDSWVRQIYPLFRHYGRKNVIFYVADHRGVYKSSSVVELRQNGDRRSWRRVGPSQRVKEQFWEQNVVAFEESAGFPVVAMSCTNAARDLALITRVLKRYAVPKAAADKHKHKFYLHAQSYGTMVALRAMQLLPSAYDAVLLEGLASLEMVEESVKADYELLRACDDDPTCRQRIRAPHEGIENAFDVRKMIKNISKSGRNASCRAYLHRQFNRHLYSSAYSFNEALQTALYELLTDDFTLLSTGTTKSANAAAAVSDQFAGMLVLPLIKNLYFCHDEVQFQRQVDRIIRIIRERIRGLPTTAIDSSASSSKGRSKRLHFYESKSKSSHQRHQGIPDSVFVRSYINIHEAYDLRRMKRDGYCDRKEFQDLGNQCTIYRAQVRKMAQLKALTGQKDKFSRTALPSSATATIRDGNGKSFHQISIQADGDFSSNSNSSSGPRKEALAQELMIQSAPKRVSFSELKKWQNEDDSAAASDDDDDESSSSSSSSSDSSSDHHKALEKAKHKSQQRKHRRKHVSKSNNKLHKFLGVVKKTKGHGKGKAATFSANLFATVASNSTSSSANTASFNGKRRYYYDLDPLAYSLPMTSARVYVVGGTLDFKTPSIAARRILGEISAPQKHFFEVEKVAHTTHACPGPIIQAFLRGDRGAIDAAERCLAEFKAARKLDWTFGEEDWW